MITYEHDWDGLSFYRWHMEGGKPYEGPPIERELKRTTHTRPLTSHIDLLWSEDVDAATRKLVSEAVANALDTLRKR